MANISTYLENAILNHVFRDIGYTRPGTVYCGIVSSSGTDQQLEAGTLTNEITAYTGNRKEIVFGDAPSQVDGKATISNTNEVEFENMPSVTVKYAIICDDTTSGNILYWLPMVNDLGEPITKTTNSGDTFRIPIGDLTIDLD